MPETGEAGPENAGERRRLVCMCTVAVRRGSVVRPVRQRRWDCPSCGRDKRERLALMAMVACPVRMVTLTVPDERVPDGAWFTEPNGRVTVAWLPAWHEGGAPYGHTYVHRDGTVRFAPQTWCAPCLRHLGRLWQRWVQRARLVLPGLEYQWAVEATSGKAASGSVPRWHRHVLLAGVPRWLPADVRDKVTADWRELSGGNLDLGRPGGGSVQARRRLAFYLSKYASKAATRMAFGYRRWGRSRGYADAVRMREPVEPRPWGDPGAEAVVLGPWVQWAARHNLPLPPSLAAPVRPAPP